MPWDDEERGRCKGSREAAELERLTTPKWRRKEPPELAVWGDATNTAHVLHLSKEEPAVGRTEKVKKGAVKPPRAESQVSGPECTPE